MKFMQRLGRSFMLPVAVLPVAAILMGIANWIRSTAGENVAVTFLNAAGSALLDNMPILFAIGISLGMATKTDGTSALSGLVSWLTFQKLLEPKTIALFQGIEVEDVNPAFGVINNVFIGIITSFQQITHGYIFCFVHRCIERSVTGIALENIVDFSFAHLQDLSQLFS